MLVCLSGQGVVYVTSSVISVSLLLLQPGDESRGRFLDSASVRAQRGCGLFLSYNGCQSSNET